MTREAFERAIRNGLGRVIVYLQEHDAGPFRDIILQACLQNSAYDTQVEGTRSEYLFEIINLTNDKICYRDAILGALADVADDEGWQVEHLFYLAGEFARAGDTEARQAMFDKVDVELANENWIALGLIEYFGIEGFLFLIDLLGEEVLATGKVWDGDYYLRALEEQEPRIPEDEIRVALDRARAENPRVEAYLAAVENNIQNREPLRPPDKQEKMDKSYEELRQSIEEHAQRSDRPLFWAKYWGEHASPAKLSKAAADFSSFTDERELTSYLSIFWRVPYPLDPSPIIALATHENDLLALSATNVLEIIENPAIRKLALHMIGQELRIGWAVGMLQSNFETSDWRVIEQLTAANLVKEDYHSLSFSVREIFEKHVDVAGAKSLLNIYENNPCSVCRERIVELLYSVGQLSEDIREECKYDANIDLRKWILEAEQN